MGEGALQVHLLLAHRLQPLAREKDRVVQKVAPRPYTAQPRQPLHGGVNAGQQVARPVGGGVVVDRPVGQGIPFQHRQRRGGGDHGAVGRVADAVVHKVAHPEVGGVVVPGQVTLGVKDGVGQPRRAGEEDAPVIDGTHRTARERLTGTSGVGGVGVEKGHGLRHRGKLAFVRRPLNVQHAAAHRAVVAQVEHHPLIVVLARYHGALQLVPGGVPLIVGVRGHRRAGAHRGLGVDRAEQGVVDLAGGKVGVIGQGVAGVRQCPPVQPHRRHRAAGLVDGVKAAPLGEGLPAVGGDLCRVERGIVVPHRHLRPRRGRPLIGKRGQRGALVKGVALHRFQRTPQRQVREGGAVGKRRLLNAPQCGGQVHAAKGGATVQRVPPHRLHPLRHRQALDGPVVLKGAGGNFGHAVGHAVNGGGAGDEHQRRRGADPHHPAGPLGVAAHLVEQRRAGVGIVGGVPQVVALDKPVTEHIALFVRPAVLVGAGDIPVRHRLKGKAVRPGVIGQGKVVSAVQQVQLVRHREAHAVAVGQRPRHLCQVQGEPVTFLQRKDIERPPRVHHAVAFCPLQGGVFPDAVHRPAKRRQHTKAGKDLHRAPLLRLIVTVEVDQRAEAAGGHGGGGGGKVHAPESPLPEAAVVCFVRCCHQRLLSLVCPARGGGSPLSK